MVIGNLQSFLYACSERFIALIVFLDIFLYYQYTMYTIYITMKCEVHLIRHEHVDFVNNCII